MRYIKHFFFILTILLPLQCAHAFSFNSFLNIFHTQKVRPQTFHSGKPKPQPLRIKVGVYLLHVGKYDLQSATTQLDFYLIFKCSPVCKDMQFEIMNATHSNIRLVDKKQGTIIYRVQSDMNKNANLRNYPFDNHSLDIIIEDRQMTSDKMIFEADPSITALDNDLNIVGFNISPAWQVKVTQHYYSVFQQTYSNYKFSVAIKRPWLAGMLKGVLPELIIISCGFLALFMKISHISSRLGLATSALVASEVFHLNLTSSLPPLGYMTYADMFMLINYLFLFTIVIEVLITTYYCESKHETLAMRINFLCAYLMPCSWLIAQIVNWIVYSP